MSDAPSIFVVLLSYNGLSDTRKCLTSLRPAIRPWVSLLLVDNGSTDGTGDAIRAEYPWCPILSVPVNRGPVVGNNAGIEQGLAAGARWIMLLNNDTTVHPDLFDRMRDAAEAHPDYDVIGPVIYFMDDPDVVMTDGCNYNVAVPYGFFKREEVPLTRSTPPAITPVDIVNGCCMMIRSEAIRRVGLFDEAFFMYHDETDYCLRVASSGGRLGVIDHALVWHKGSATSAGTGKKSIRYFDARNLLRLLKKHGLSAGQGRGPFGTLRAYATYMHGWYGAEARQGNPLVAEAVVDGICDGLMGRTGPYQPGPRRLAPLVRRAMSMRTGNDLRLLPEAPRPGAPS